MVDNSQEYRLKYWATRSSVHSFVRTAPVRLLRTARFARALRCAHSFARSFTLLTPSLVGQWMIGWQFCLCLFLFLTIVYPLVDPTIYLYICPNICPYIHLLVCTSCWLTLHQSVWPISLLVELAKASVCHGNGWKDDQHFEWKFLLRRIMNLHRKRENQKIKKIRRIKINLGCVWFFSLCKNLPLFQDS